jgi:hypothetical protein
VLPTRSYNRICRLVEQRRCGVSSNARQGSLLQLADDPDRRQLVRQPFSRMAEALRLPDSRSVVATVEARATELVYMKALRNRLLSRINAMSAKLGRIT